jgi:glycosyltransferase involved in cell wall biosynthesis
MSKLQVHTVEQPDSEITAFILSCNRLDLLAQTVQSFLATKDLATKIVMVDDSGEPGVFDKLVSSYGHFADIVCFPENRGLWWAKDFMVSFCSTKYIFYVEEDWLFLNNGYLQKSLKILEDHREIGSIDLSWRTFEDEGYDAYYPELIDGEFFRKKPWQISPSHYHWFCWQGSPNLKRREDLLLLGRVEKYYTEWNIDRKFFALGFRGAYLKDRYVTHLGDYRSLMAKKRPNEQATPETLFPDELRPNRIYPALDYHGMDDYAKTIRNSTDIYRNNTKTFVTCLFDIDREKRDGRNFLQHYLGGLSKLFNLGFPLVVFVDARYYYNVMAITGGKPIYVLPLDPRTFAWTDEFTKIAEICAKESWQNQAEWMKTSIIRSPEYLGLTLHKMKFLMHCVNHNVFRSEAYYWIDAGMCSSFNINTLESFDFSKLPADKFFMPAFPYLIDKEMHGYSKEGFETLCRQIPDFVCRATLFGGTKQAIIEVDSKYNDFLRQSLSAGYIGTEEAIFSGLAVEAPQLFNLAMMPNGDINHYLATLRG